MSALNGCAGCILVDPIIAPKLFSLAIFHLLLRVPLDNKHGDERAEHENDEENDPEDGRLAADVCMSRIALSPVALATLDMTFRVFHALVVALTGHARAINWTRAEVRQAIEIALAHLTVLDLWYAGVSVHVTELAVSALVRRLLAEVSTTGIFVELALIAVVERIIYRVVEALVGLAFSVRYTAHSIRSQQGAGELHI